MIILLVLWFLCDTFLNLISKYFSFFAVLYIQIILLIILKLIHLLIILFLWAMLNQVNIITFLTIICFMSMFWFTTCIVCILQISLLFATLWKRHLTQYLILRKYCIILLQKILNIKLVDIKHLNNQNTLNN
jgi:hypothetical protein